MGVFVTGPFLLAAAAAAAVSFFFFFVGTSSAAAVVVVVVAATSDDCHLLLRDKISPCAIPHPSSLLFVLPHSSSGLGSNARKQQCMCRHHKQYKQYRQYQHLQTDELRSISISPPIRSDCLHSRGVKFYTQPLRRRHHHYHHHLFSVSSDCDENPSNSTASNDPTTNYEFDNADDVSGGGNLPTTNNENNNENSNEDNNLVIIDELAWRVAKVRLEEANTKRFLARRPLKMSYAQSRRFIQRNWGPIRTRNEFEELVANGDLRTPYISKRPEEYYGRRGEWISWEHYLSGEECYISSNSTSSNSTSSNSGSNSSSCNGIENSTDASNGRYQNQNVVMKWQ